MRTMLLIGLVSVGLGLTAGSLFGDVPPFGGGKRPERDDHLAPPVPQMAALPPPNATHITIVVSKDVTKPRLEIPGPVLEKCAPKGEKVGENRNLRLPVAGSLVFALALAGGALFLVRGRTRWAATAMLLAVGVALSSGHSAAEANAPPPHFPVTNQKVQLGETLLDDVEVVVSPDWGEVKLTLPRSVAAKFKR